MVTQFHTLLHFVTHICTITTQITANLHSKSHLLGIISDYAEHLCVCYKPLQRGLYV
jgi:hypothetical protein